MRPIVIAGTLIILLCGCAAVKPHDNAVVAGDIGLHNEVPVTTAAGRDISPNLQFVGGNIGMCIVALAAIGVAYRAVKKA